MIGGSLSISLKGIVYEKMKMTSFLLTDILKNETVSVTTDIHYVKKKKFKRHF